jgi:hypothetical protein
MFRRSTDKNPKNGEDENPFLLSFSDLMASLLAIFILALVVMMIQLHKQKLDLTPPESVSKEQHEKILKENERLKALLAELKTGLKEIQTIQAKVIENLDAVGSSREKRLANMLLPVPGGPLRRRLWPPAAAISRARLAWLCAFTPLKSG